MATPPPVFFFLTLSPPPSEPWSFRSLFCQTSLSCDLLFPYVTSKEDTEIEFQFSGSSPNLSPLYSSSFSLCPLFSQLSLPTRSRTALGGVHPCFLLQRTHAPFFFFWFLFCLSRLVFFPPRLCPRSPLLQITAATPSTPHRTPSFFFFLPSFFFFFDVLCISLVLGPFLFFLRLLGLKTHHLRDGHRSPFDRRKDKAFIESRFG